MTPSPSPAAASLGATSLAAWQVRNEQRAFWRNRRAAIFSFGFPIMLLLVFGLLNKGNTVDTAASRGRRSTSPASSPTAIVTTAFSNIADQLRLSRATTA